MLLIAEICENTIRGWKYIGLFLLIVKIIVAIVVIVKSFFTIWTVIAKGSAETAIKAAFDIARKLAAAVIVVLIPTIITSIINLLIQDNTGDEFVACEACLKDPGSSNCNNFILAYDEKEKEEIQKFKEKKIEGDVDTCEMGLTGSPPLDFSYKGNGTVKAQFSSNNLKIVEQHLNDFTSDNFHSYINSLGGFKKYTEKLGGIYADYFGKTWEGETIQDLQMASEYVFGYMTMYGFDYFNGRDFIPGEGQKYCKWGGSCIYFKDIYKAEHENPPRELPYPSGTSDAFYPGNTHYDEHGLSKPKEHFDAIIQGNNMTTNCNWSVDMVYWKAGIFKRGKRADGTPEPQDSLDFGWVRDHGKVIERLCDLKVGDILHFFDTPVDHTNMSTWFKWKHVAFIGEIDAETGTITVYDGGSYQQVNRNFKWTFNGKGEWPAGLHGYKGWSAVRVKELK